MIDVNTARQLISQHRVELHAEQVTLENALDRVLVDNHHTDRDLPPYDRITMDGIAISAADYQRGVRSFARESRQYAGDARISRSERVGTCIETSTGAILPGNCDAVIPYEWLEETEGRFDLVDERAVTTSMNVHVKGSDLGSGTTILPAGSLIDAGAVTMLASIGCSEVSVKRLPRLAIISTGDELVEVGATPLHHQIRRSNNYSIAALLAPLGVKASSYHLPDNRSILDAWMQNQRHNYDVLIFSGGVSMGKRDFMPSVLRAAGIDEVFHRIAQRPGKPLWFGAGDRQVVFGLPGNPVSTIVSTIVYVRTWLELCLGIAPPLHRTNHALAVIEREVTFAPSLTLFKAVRTFDRNGVRLAEPIEGNGSGDFSSLIGVNGFIELPAHEVTFKAGTALAYHPLTWRRN